METISTNKPISAAKKTSQYRYFPIPMLYLTLRLQRPYMLLLAHENRNMQEP